MADWRLESHTRSGTYLAPLKFYNLQGEFYRNRRQIRFDLALSSSGLTYDTFFPRKHEVWAYRDDELVFAGPLWDVSVSSREGKMSCGAAGIESYFDTRVASTTDRDMTGTWGSIVWGLINTSQGLTGGGLGITQGTLVGGGSPSGSFKYAWREGKTLSEVIDDLADSDAGFDWEITPNRVHNQYYPRIDSRARVRLEYGGNITSYSLQAMGKYEANAVFVKGPEQTVSNWAIDTAKRSEYGLSHFVGSNTGLKSASLLDAFADMTLKLRRDARIVPQVVTRSEGVNPFEGDIEPGQLSRLIVRDEWVQFDQDMRLMGFQVTVGKQGNEVFSLYLSDMREIS